MKKVLMVEDCLRDCYYFEYMDNGKGECPPTCLLQNKEDIVTVGIDDTCPLLSIEDILNFFIEWLDHYDFLDGSPFRTPPNNNHPLKMDDFEKSLIIEEFIADRGGIIIKEDIKCHLVYDNLYISKKLKNYYFNENYKLHCFHFNDYSHLFVYDDKINGLYFTKEKCMDKYEVMDYFNPTSKEGWDSAPNTDYVTESKTGTKKQVKHMEELLLDFLEWETTIFNFHFNKDDAKLWIYEFLKENYL